MILWYIYILKRWSHFQKSFSNYPNFWLCGRCKSGDIEGCGDKRFLLEYNCFTTCVSFCCTMKWNSYVCAYISFLLDFPPTCPLYHPSRSTQHQTELPVLYSRFPLAIYSTHGSWACSVVKESACQSRRCRFNPWVGKIPGGGSGNILQYSCLENPMDRAWQASVHGVAKG